MKINFDEKNYRIEKKQTGPDEYNIIVTPRKRNCKYCCKSFDSIGTEFITWKDDNNYLRSGYFCKRHFVTITKALKIIKSRI